jgi:RNA polymerase sigma-70 factor, ECF subfamily
VVRQSPARARERELSQEDVEVIQRVLAGETAAFALLVQRYEAVTYRLAYRMTRNAEDARDLTQETFVQAFRALGGFQRQAKFSTWLYRIGMNLCLNHLRSAGRQDPGEVDPQLPDTREGSLDQLLISERDRAVAAAIEELPPQQKATLLLRVHEGLSHKEIASVLECAEGTAKANYFHAVRALQRKLQPLRGEGAE